MHMRMYDDLLCADFHDRFSFPAILHNKEQAQLLSAKSMRIIAKEKQIFIYVYSYIADAGKKYRKVKL